MLFLHCMICKYIGLYLYTFTGVLPVEEDEFQLQHFAFLAPAVSLQMRQTGLKPAIGLEVKSIKPGENGLHLPADSTFI